MHTIKIENGTKYHSEENKKTRITREDGISSHLALINFLKGMIGPGCFSLPLAFKEAGLWAGFGLVFLIGLFTCICMLKIVRCSQQLAVRDPQLTALDYGQMAEKSCLQSFQILHKYHVSARTIVTICLMTLQLGICSIYYIFVVEHAKEIFEIFYPNQRLTKYQYFSIALLPFGILSCIRNIQLMSFVSLAGNILMTSSIVVIFSQLVKAKHLTNDLPWFTDFHGIARAAGSIIYSFEGQALVLPLENKILHPSEMSGCTGVISTGISLVTIVYASSGFYGFITYGNQVQGSITLNMERNNLNLGVKLLLLLVVYTGYLLQLYAIVECIHPLIASAIKNWNVGKSKKRILNAFNYGIRITVVFASFFLALMVPNLENIIPMIGMTSGMMLALIIPSLLDIVIFLPRLIKKKDWLNVTMNLCGNIFFIFLGILFLISGINANIRHLFL